MSTPSDNRCQETSGFLFKHACSHLGTENCALCNKLICHQHQRVKDNSMVCIACAKQGARQASRSQHQDSTHDHRSHYRTDPYLYGTAFYLGYGNYGHGHWGSSHYSQSRSHGGGGGHDANDFTAGDAASLAAEGDDAFETDMGES